MHPARAVATAPHRLHSRRQQAGHARTPRRRTRRPRGPVRLGQRGHRGGRGRARPRRLDRAGAGSDRVRNLYLGFDRQAQVDPQDHQPARPRKRGRRNPLAQPTRYGHARHRVAPAYFRHDFRPVLAIRHGAGIRGEILRIQRGHPLQGRALRALRAGIQPVAPRALQRSDRLAGHHRALRLRYLVGGAAGAGRQPQGFAPARSTGA